MSNQIGKDATILTMSKVLTLLISMISAMLLSRFRTLTEYGTYSQILILANLASAIFSLGLPSSTNFFLARLDTAESRHRFLSVFYTLCTIVSVIMGITLLFTIPLSSAYFNNSGIAAFGFFLGVFPWTRLIISSIGNVLIVYKKTRKLLFLNFVNSLISLLAIAIVQIFKWSFREYMIIYLSCECCITVWVYIIICSLEGKITVSFDQTLIKSIFKYSIPIGLAGLVGTISIEIDKLMIGKFFDTESLAIYTNAAKELPFTIMASSFTAVLLPQMARRLKDGDNEGTVKVWGDSVHLCYIIICFCTMACVVFAPQIISIMYSNKYLPGVSVFRIYSLVMLLRVTYFGMVLNSIGKTKFILYCSIASLALNTVLNYAMYLLVGFEGPAIATLLSIGLVGYLQLVYTAKILKIKLKKLFPWHRIMKVTLINCIILVLLLVLTRILHIQTDTMSNTIAIIIGVVVMVAYGVCMKRRVLCLWRTLNEEK